MHNVDYDPGPWRQTLNLPPPEIEPGSHASQAGTLTKELSRQLIPVLRIRDVYPRSRILIFSHPGSRIQKQQQKRGVKKICCLNFLCSHKFHKIANYFNFELLKKKIWVNFQRIVELFNQNCQQVLKNMGLGSRGQNGTGSATLAYTVSSGRGHALSQPPPGIEPGSPASQAGTLPKELSRLLIL